MKYYTPKLEDLFVGYETTYKVIGEYSLCYSKNEEENYVYIPQIIDANIISLCEQYNKSESKDFTNFKGCPYTYFFKTPYLTKQHIESEGFIPTNVHDIFTENYDIAEGFEKNISEDNHILIIYNYDTKILKCYIMIIPNREYGNWEVDNCFKGFCPSINEFRNIIKLLIIK